MCKITATLVEIRAKLREANFDESAIAFWCLLLNWTDQLNWTVWDLIRSVDVDNVHENLT